MSRESVTKGSPTLTEIARQIEASLGGTENTPNHPTLDSSITITNRKNLESDFEEMKKEPKEERSIFFDQIEELLKNSSNQWFAFYVVNTESNVRPAS
jgi:hypothetical protein